MPRTRIARPATAWPPSIRDRFEALELSTAQRKRLGGALGQWVSLAADPLAPSPGELEVVAAQLPSQTRKQTIQHMRQALAEVFPAAGKALFRDRDWRWLSRTHKRMQKIARASPSRNAGRALPIDELRGFGFDLFAEAEQAFEAAHNLRSLTKAHTMARTALSIVLLAEAPTRIGALASVVLDEDLIDTLAHLHVEAGETKTKAAEDRLLSAAAVRCITSYVDRFRVVFAQPASRTLFIGEDGNPVKGATLSSNIGRFTEARLQHRVTAHVFRHAAGNFILAAAPDQAALASVILKHRHRDTSTLYTKSAGQVEAGRALAEASRSTARALGAETRVSKCRKRRLPKRLRNTSG